MGLKVYLGLKVYSLHYKNMIVKDL